MLGVHMKDAKDQYYRATDRQFGHHVPNEPADDVTLVPRDGFLQKHC